MSTQSSREQEEQHANTPMPACDASHTADSDWEYRDAAPYPPGYPRLCRFCFTHIAPEELSWDERGHVAEWDHTEVLDEFVRTDSSTTDRRMHLPARHPRADEAEAAHDESADLRGGGDE